MYRCHVIGMSDSHQQDFSPQVQRIIREGRVFSGGLRHHEIVESLLPADACWIDITVPLSDVLAQYAVHDEVVIFASGDPLFFGFATTVQRAFPEVEMQVYPHFHSLQTLAHRLCMPYHAMHVVSLTGRPWTGLDAALIEGKELIGCLTDRHKTPHTIWQRMQTYGYDNYSMWVGENLGHETKERVAPYDPLHTYSHPNCLLLQRTRVLPRPFGIPETEFALLDGRAKMITKMPIRLLTLARLDLHQKVSMWDVGFCTGSVSIEAKLQFPHLDITAFEIREEGRELMETNSRRFHTPGITAVIGDFMEADLSRYTPPDAVFIGGHGGHLHDMVQRLRSVLHRGGCIVFNSVSTETQQDFYAAVQQAGMRLVSDTLIQIDEHHSIHIMKAEA